ncbi:LuxR C-terminal-related transcriptional regulator, partial [Streptomyces spectabilis]
SATRAQERGGVAAAAAFLERSAALTINPVQRTERTLAAVRAKLSVGDFDTAADLLTTVRTDDPGQAARADLLRGRLSFARRRGDEGPTAHLLRAAARLATTDPAWSRECSLDAIEMGLLLGGFEEVVEAVRVASLGDEPDSRTEAPPGATAPGLGVPGPGTPGSGAPGVTAPDSAVPGPGMRGPETSVAAAPGVMALAPEALDSAAPAPGTHGPETPGAAAPDPGTPSRGTPVPETTGVTAPGLGTRIPAAPDVTPPDSGTPSLEAPDSAAPNAGTPSPEPPDSAAPDVTAPGSGTPSPGTPSPETSDVATPGPGTPSPKAPASAAPAPGTPGPEAPDPGTPSSGAPISETSDSATPSVTAPGPRTPAPGTPSPEAPASAAPNAGSPGPGTPSPQPPAPAASAPAAPAQPRPAPAPPRAKAHLPPPSGTPAVLSGLIRLVGEGHVGAGDILGPVVGDVGAEVWARRPSLGFMLATELWNFDSLCGIAARAAAAGRGAGSFHALPIALAMQATAAVHRGDFGAATELISEEEAIADATGAAPLVYPRLHLAALRGRREEALTLFASVDHRMSLSVRWATAVLSNGLADYPAALKAAQQAFAYGAVGTAGLALPELVEAAVRCGEPETAAAAHATLRQRTQAGRQAWGLGVEACARALVTGDESAYQEAIALLDDGALVVYRARAHLLYGEWLRRQGRRRDARAALRLAHEALSDLGMEAFAERAAGELRATGEQARSRASKATDQLTMQEVHIARLVADGATSKEVAAKLFLSPRTVDAHLRNIFRKLGLTSRRQLRDLPEIR